MVGRPWRMGCTVRHIRAERDAALNEVRDASVVFDASMKVRLDRPLLDVAPELRLVITATTGADHIDSAALAARGIPLLTLKTERDFLRGITPAAELSWLLLLACARRLRAALRHVEQGGWDRELFPGTILRGRTLGLIGCGRIGGWMARYARAFDMTVIGHDPFVSELPAEVKAVSLPELLQTADFVSIHVHYSDATRGLLGAEELALMKVAAALINTSRGAIVDESALLASLAAGKPAALGVDVLEGEPDIRTSRLWQYAQTHDNVIITPHIGGFSPDALASVLRHTAARMSAASRRWARAAGSPTCMRRTPSSSAARARRTGSGRRSPASGTRCSLVRRRSCWRGCAAVRRRRSPARWPMARALQVVDACRESSASGRAVLITP